MLGLGSVGGEAPLVPRAVPPRLTPSTALLGINQLTAWEAVAVLAPDGTVKAGNTLYSRYCKTGKRTKQGSGRSRRENREGGDAASQGATQQGWSQVGVSRELTVGAPGFAPCTHKRASAEALHWQWG